MSIEPMGSCEYSKNSLRMLWILKIRRLRTSLSADLDFFVGFTAQMPVIYFPDKQALESQQKDAGHIRVVGNLGNRPVYLI